MVLSRERLRNLRIIVLWVRDRSGNWQGRGCAWDQGGRPGAGRHRRNACATFSLRGNLLWVFRQLRISHSFGGLGIMVRGELRATGMNRWEPGKGRQSAGAELETRASGAPSCAVVGVLHGGTMDLCPCSPFLLSARTFPSSQSRSPRSPVSPLVEVGTAASGVKKGSERLVLCGSGRCGWPHYSTMC